MLPGFPRGFLRSHLDEVRARLPVEGPYVLRIVVAAAVGWQICVWLGATQPPVYAVIVPLVTLRDEPGSAWNLSFGRLVGVVAGLLVGIGVLAWLRPSVGAVALTLTVALALGIVLRAGGSMNIQIALSALLVLASTAPESYAVNRLWETGVGAVVTAVLAPLMFPTDPVRAFRRELQAVAQECAALLREAAPMWRGTGDPAALDRRAHAVDRRAHDLQPALEKARTAVRLHPFWHRHSTTVAALGPAAEDITTVAALVRTHTEDLAELRARPDAQDWLAAQGGRAEALDRAVAQALDLTLAGPAGTTGPAGTDRRDAAALRHLREILSTDTAADPTPLGVISRRPTERILTVLQGLGAPRGG